MKKFFYLITILIAITSFHSVKAQSDTLRIGVAGSAPFVVLEDNSNTGVSVEIWEEIAKDLSITYIYKHFDDVPKALDQLERGNIDLVVGPVRYII